MNAPFAELDPDLFRARELVMEFGWNSTAYQILNPGIRLWFSAAGDATVGYVRRNGVRVAVGAPVAPAARLREVVAEFEADAARGAARVCFFAAGERLNALLGPDTGHSRVLLGAQPAWNPASWPAIIDGHKSLRAQLNRARNKEVEVAEWNSARAREHPELHRLLREWLATRGLPPLHFMVEPQTLGRLFDRRIFVAEQAGTPVGFLVASPVPQRNGWLVEQFVRGRDAPNGTVELMIDATMRWMAEQEFDYVTLGLAPLSRRGEVSPTANPLWLRALLGWLRVHGNRFYNFSGLDAFKAKLDPEDWEPIYAISNQRRFGPRPLYAIAAAFSGGSPLVVVARGLLGAVRQEMRWIGRQVRG